MVTNSLPNAHKCEDLQVQNQSNDKFIRFAAMSDTCVFSNRVCMYADVGSKEENNGWGGNLLPPCSLLYCTAAVSAGMAPLTICSLIAKIRVHFLGHWSGNERWQAELWAFFCLPFSLYGYSPCLGHTNSLTHKLNRRLLTHLAYL